MKNRKKKINYITIYSMCALMVLLLVGIILYTIWSRIDRNPIDQPVASQPLSQDTKDDIRGQFLILRNDSVQEELYVYSYEDCEEYRYRYSISTEFLDQYGDHLSVSKFMTGRVVELFVDSGKRELEKVQLSDAVWELTDIVRYSVDENMQMLTIGSDRYSMKEAVFFSDDKKISLSDITEKDELMIIGKDKNVLSIVITTGHGILSVTNSSEEVDFSGGYIQIGQKMFAKINGDMEIEIQEGTYNVAAVSPDGYGDSTEITIQRGATVELDLATLQGEGPKKGYITFSINDDTAKVKVDNKEVDITKPVELTYGLHPFIVITDNYENYARYLFVNSEGAKVSIDMAAVAAPKPSTQPETTVTERETENTQGSETTQKPSESQSTQKPSHNKPSVPSTSELIEQEKDKNQGGGTSGSSTTQSSTSSQNAEETYVNGILSTLGNILGQ